EDRDLDELTLRVRHAEREIALGHDLQEHCRGADLAHRAEQHPRQERSIGGGKVEMAESMDGIQPHGGERRPERNRNPEPARVHQDSSQPRPTKGILVAMIVMNWTLTSSGCCAMYRTASPTRFTSMVGSTLISRFACGTPLVIFAAISVSALPISICEQAMSYLRPSSEADFVSPVTPCLVDV